MKVTFTGHRPGVLINKARDKQRLQEVIGDLLATEMVEQWIVGGAPGFDTWALEVLLEMIPKEKILITVPFIGFERYAGSSHEAANQEAFNLNTTCGVTVLEVGGVTGTYGQKCHRRNQYMIKQADVVVTNWTGKNGGTANTIKLAKIKGIRIINLHGDAIHG